MGNMKRRTVATAGLRTPIYRPCSNPPVLKMSTPHNHNALPPLQSPPHRSRGHNPAIHPLLPLPLPHTHLHHQNTIPNHNCISIPMSQPPSIRPKHNHSHQNGRLRSAIQNSPVAEFLPPLRAPIQYPYILRPLPTQPLPSVHTSRRLVHHLPNHHNQQPRFRPLLPSKTALGAKGRSGGVGGHDASVVRHPTRSLGIG